MQGRQVWQRTFIASRSPSVWYSLFCVFLSAFSRDTSFSVEVSSIRDKFDTCAPAAPTRESAVARSLSLVRSWVTTQRHGRTYLFVQPGVAALELADEGIG